MLFLRQTRSHFEKNAWKENARKFQNCTWEQKFSNRSKPKAISGNFPSGGDQVPSLGFSPTFHHSEQDKLDIEGEINFRTQCINV